MIVVHKSYTNKGTIIGVKNEGKQWCICLQHHSLYTKSGRFGSVGSIPSTPAIVDYYELS